LFIKTEQGGKKKGEKTSRLDNFTVLSPTFFFCCYLWGKRVINGIASHRPFFPCCNCHPHEFIKSEQGGKKKGETQSIVLIFLVLQLTVFQLVCYFWGDHMIFDIAANRLTFTPSPLPPGCVY
jgi:hypothetical protein